MAAGKWSRDGGYKGRAINLAFSRIKSALRTISPSLRLTSSLKIRYFGRVKTPIVNLIDGSQDALD